MNVKRIAQPVTPYEKEYTRRQVMAMHPSMQRQVYLDHHCMSVSAQARIHNDPQRTLLEWVEELT